MNLGQVAVERQVVGATMLTPAWWGLV